MAGYLSSRLNCASYKGEVDMILLSVAICIVGLVLYLIASTAKPMEVGRLMFAVGLLAYLMRSTTIISLFAR